MKVYVAAPYPARTYVQSLFVVLAEAGHECTSTWALGTREINITTVGASPATLHHDLVRHVTGDLYDVARADALIELTAEFCIKKAGLNYDPTWMHTGGRHVEMGYALGMKEQRKPYKIITVGEPENVFQRGLSVVVPDLDSAIRALSGHTEQRHTEGAVA